MWAKIQRFRLFLYSIRYTRFKQLFSRLRLLIKRKLYQHVIGKYVSAKHSSSDEIYSFSSDRHKPLFPPRRHLVNNNELVFLNRRRPLSIAMDWHPQEMKNGTRLWLLNLHYMEFLEALDDEMFYALILDWIGKNKPYRNGYWLDDWNSYALSIRVVVWMQQLNIRSSNSNEGNMEKIHHSLIAQLYFLSNNLELDICGNHIIKNIKALLWGGAYFKGNEALSWFNTGKKLLERELSEQILSDGMHFELSPAYHSQVFADFLECYQVLDECELKYLLEENLVRMAQVLTDLTQDDGYVSLFNDGGLRMAYSPENCLDIFTGLTGKQLVKQKCFQYPDSGYYGIRDNSNELIIDCGPLAPDYLPAHGHGDMFSFEWSINGARFIVDAGVYEYNFGEMRDYSRNTTSHNTVTLDDLSQSEFWQAFRVGRRARITDRTVNISEHGFSIKASHNGYSHLDGSPLHSRLFEYSDGLLKITDEIEGGKGQNVSARLLLNPDCTTEKTGTNTINVKLNDEILKIESVTGFEENDAWWCPDFGVRLITKQIVINYGKAPCIGVIKLEHRCAI